MHSKGIKANTVTAYSDFLNLKTHSLHFEKLKRPFCLSAINTLSNFFFFFAF